MKALRAALHVQVSGAWEPSATAAGAIDRAGVGVPELLDEVAILWSDSPDERLTLPEAIRRAELEWHPYAYARTLDGKIDRTPSRAKFVPSELPVPILRLLRGKAR